MLAGDAAAFCAAFFYSGKSQLDITLLHSDTHCFTSPFNEQGLKHPYVPTKRLSTYTSKNWHMNMIEPRKG